MVPPNTTATVQPGGKIPKSCPRLAKETDILSVFAKDLCACGVVGEERLAKIIYLVITSRFFERPASVVVKGTSAGGKSRTVEETLRFFPDQAFHALTAMSEKALIYSDRDLQHRILVIYEMSALSSEIGSYLLRSLLSEGQIRYEVTVRDGDDYTTRLVEQKGPTGLIVTTTANELHPENETRMLSVTIDDSMEQTRRVLLAEAQAQGEKPNLERWKALQTWLKERPQNVVVPYSERLAELIRPVAVRIRRDFPLILTLIRAHALLHQLNRSQDSEGRIVATLDDYIVVRDLVAELVAEGVEAAVPRIVRETVEAVVKLQGEGVRFPNIQQVADTLGRDKSATHRRVRKAIGLGFLRNLQLGQGRPAELTLGEAVPEDHEVLPPPERLS